MLPSPRMAGATEEWITLMPRVSMSSGMTSILTVERLCRFVGGTENVCRFFAMVGPPLARDGRQETLHLHDDIAAGSGMGACGCVVLTDGAAGSTRAEPCPA